MSVEMHRQLVFESIFSSFQSQNRDKSTLFNKYTALILFNLYTFKGVACTPLGITLILVIKITGIICVYIGHATNEFKMRFHNTTKCIICLYNDNSHLRVGAYQTTKMWMWALPEDNKHVSL